MNLILDHKAAVVARLKTSALLAPCGYEGIVKPIQDPNYPNDPTKKVRPAKYWTFFTDSGSRGTDRLGGIPGQRVTLRYTIHWVGSTPQQAQTLADPGVALLAGCQLTVPGWAPFRMTHVASQTTQMDDTVKPPLHFIADQFELVTQPA